MANAKAILEDEADLEENEDDPSAFWLHFESVKKTCWKRIFNVIFFVRTIIREKFNLYRIKLEENKK